MVKGPDQGGPQAVLYASVEILDAYEEDESSLRRMTLQPTWAANLNHPTITLKRHQVGSLCLATHLDRDGDWMRVQLADCKSRRAT